MRKLHPEPPRSDDALVDLPTIERHRTGAALVNAEDEGRRRAPGYKQACISQQEPPSNVNARVGKIVEPDVDVPVPLEY